MFLLSVIVATQSCQTTAPKQEHDNKQLTGSWKFVADQELDD